jgi:cell division protein FtsB
MQPNKILAYGFLALVIWAAVPVVRTIRQNIEMGQQIKRVKTETAILQDQRDILKEKVLYYQTDSFREREAREKLGLQMPGESVVIIREVK